MSGIEAGIDPLNWTIGISFGDPSKPVHYISMLVIGPFYLIFWPVQ